MPDCGSQCLIPGVLSIEGCRRRLDRSSAHVGVIWLRVRDMACRNIDTASGKVVSYVAGRKI